MFAIIICLGLFLINGKSSILPFESELIGLSFSIVIYAIYISVGVRTYTEFMKALRT
jgi:hypothetical protein